nr:Cro/CI family transcriptional regulator [Stenotrophomonas pavanii]
MATVYGTDNQHRYLNMLRAKVGDDAVATVSRKVLGIDPAAELPSSIGVDETSQIITLLKEVDPKAAGRPPAALERGQGTGTPKRLTGRELLRLAELGNPVPTDLDPDMYKVVMRLRRLSALQDLSVNPDRPIALNGGGPILTSVFVALLGGPANAAKALGVTIKTVEGWGDYLPHSHESRAELVTKGAVRARLPE